MGKHAQKSTRKKQKRGKKIVNLVILLVLLCVAFVLLAWPLIKNYQTESGYATQFETIRSWQEAQTGDESSTKEDLTQALGYLESYNQQVRDGQISAINDPWGFTSADSGFAASGLLDGLVGEIIIPKMEVDLPIYLGASETNMLKGATVVYGTSAPLGEPDSNTVIAAHRGFSDGYMFNYVERLILGDTVTVKTPWATLTYEVAGFQVVDPTNVEAIKVKPQENLLTLLTCHPHPQHNKRLLVFCTLTSKVDNNNGNEESINNSKDIHGHLIEDGSIESTIPSVDNEFKLFGLDSLELQYWAIRIGLSVDALFITVIGVQLICALFKSFKN